MFIDTHAHIYDEYYESIDSIIESAKEMHVKYIINAGVNAQTNQEVLDKSNRFNALYFTLGIHPESADNYLDDDLKYIETNLSHCKCLAIGEIGLDYHYDGFNKEKQIELLKKQLNIAQKYNMPVVIHSRQATEDTINILKNYNLKGVIHSFSGSLETAKIFVKMGYKLGINGVITFKNCNAKDVVKEIGIENYVLETDSPYLTPVPYRGKVNDPGKVYFVAEFLSEFLDISLEELSEITNKNVLAIFDKFCE